MDEFERRVRKCLFEMQVDEGNGVYRPKHYKRILEGEDQERRG